MKFLLFILALVFFVSQAELSLSNRLPVHSANGKIPTHINNGGTSHEPLRLLQNSLLYQEMLKFGVQKMTQKAFASHGIQFDANPLYYARAIRTVPYNGLRVTFEVDVADVSGKNQTVTMTVNYQSWKNFMALEDYSISK